ncbi:MAG TPA: TRAP transporter small permease [Gammaproteobacteria bacterium]|jgi:TRAP-type C4-dicarboxylate transport system permease small subunit
MRFVSRASNAILGFEKRLITVLAGALVLLILFNVVTAAARVPVFWGDELAIYTMVWMTLIGASAMVRMRAGVAVTLVTDLLPANIRRSVARIADAVLLFCAVTLSVLCWWWYDPIALIGSGFDLDVFAQETFKFIYAEPTSTLAIPKFWVWLAVPLMASTMTIHALANLLEGPRDDAPAAGIGARPGA